jgi:DNA mismatch repair ATPase MutS
VRGVSDRSFGINVARLADLPASVLRRATEKADELRDAVEARAGPLAAQAAAWERLAALCTDVLANSALASDAALAERVRDAQRAAGDALPSE